MTDSYSRFHSFHEVSVSKKIMGFLNLTPTVGGGYTLSLIHIYEAGALLNEEGTFRTGANWPTVWTRDCLLYTSHRGGKRTTECPGSAGKGSSVWSREDAALWERLSRFWADVARQDAAALREWFAPVYKYFISL